MANTFRGIYSRTTDLTSTDKRAAFNKASLSNYQETCNQAEAHLCANTWLLVTQSIDYGLSLALYKIIGMFGLTKAIHDCSCIADSLLCYTEGLEQERLECLSECDEYLCSLLPVAYERVTKDGEYLARLLQCLRFPKRFAYPFDTSTADVALNKFLAVNSSHWGVSCSFESTLQYRLVQRSREIIGEILNGFVEPPMTAGLFTSGAVAEKVAGRSGKITQYMRDVPGAYGEVMYPSSSYSNPATLADAEVRVVPKNYKQGRVIAMIATVKQFRLAAVRLELERVIARSPYANNICIGDQDTNSSRCADMSCATIDFSAASDTISRKLAQQLLPKPVLDAVLPYLDTKMTLPGGRKEDCYIFALSGTSVTWHLESVIFFALCEACREVCCAFCGDLPAVTVYGDDVVMPTEAVELFYQLTAWLGMRFNRQKSFWNGGYRESCGSEFYFGVPTRSVYYPRAGVWPATPSGYNPKKLAALCDFQKNLLASGFREAADYVATQVRSLEPRMTSHALGEPCTDLWEDFPQYELRPVRALYAATSKCPLRPDLGYNKACAMREWHMSLIPIKDSMWFTRPSSGVGMFTYAEYLADGPSYPSGLDSLLHVSESRYLKNTGESEIGRFEYRMIPE